MAQFPIGMSLGRIERALRANAGFRENTCTMTWVQNLWVCWERTEYSQLSHVLLRVKPDATENKLRISAVCPTLTLSLQQLLSLTTLFKGNS